MHFTLVRVLTIHAYAHTLSLHTLACALSMHELTYAFMLSSRACVHVVVADVRVCMRACGRAGVQVRASLRGGYATLGNAEGDLTTKHPGEDQFVLGWDGFKVTCAPTITPKDTIVFVIGTGALERGCVGAWVRVSVRACAWVSARACVRACMCGWVRVWIAVG
jgi:hypothetical protein